MGYRRLLGCALLAAALLGSPAVASAGPAACAWRATALDLPAEEFSRVTATDHSGGFSGDAASRTGSSHVVAWRNGQYVDHGRLQDIWVSNVADQNRAGLIVGTANLTIQPTGYSSKPFRSVNGRLEALPTNLSPLVYPRTGAVGVTAAGDVFGYAESRDGATKLVLRWPAGRPEAVETVPGLTRRPLAVDPAGALLIDSKTIWRNGVTTTLSTLPGLTSFAATDIANGRVVGYGTFNGKEIGVYWDQRNVAQVLPNSTYRVPGGVPGFTINSDGLITGRIDAATGGNETAGTGYGIWHQGAWVSKFGDVKLDVPTVIGDDGTIGGYRLTEGGQPRPHSWRCG